jgi:hypothetical protein
MSFHRPGDSAAAQGDGEPGDAEGADDEAADADGFGDGGAQGGP